MHLGYGEQDPLKEVRSKSDHDHTITFRYSLRSLCAICMAYYAYAMYEHAYNMMPFPSLVPSACSSSSLSSIIPSDVSVTSSTGGCQIRLCF